MTANHRRPLDLKRQLIGRILLFAAGLLLIGTAIALLETRYRVRADIQRTGQTIRQLITDEVQRSAGPFHRSLEEIDIELDNLQAVGDLIHFCVHLTNIYAKEIKQRCFARRIETPPLLEELMRRVIGNDAQVHGTVGHYPGITVGQLTITPNYGSELRNLGLNLLNLLGISLTIVILSYFIYRPVRAALAPSTAMLETLKRMENGDLGARMPTLPLIELEHIAQGFNHLASRLQETIQQQQQLAHRLLTAREEERQHLARELHDEFGQYLASLNAEAGFVHELAEEQLPELKPSATAIRRTVEHMMDVLQHILHDLRPVGIDQFGLLAALEQLLASWERRQRGIRIELAAGPWIDQLPDSLSISLYRITQECITNAFRHGQARQVRVAIVESGSAVQISIEDDGNGLPPLPENQRQNPGFGLLGIKERVLALGGQLQIQPASPHGTRIEARLPLPSPHQKDSPT